MHTVFGVSRENKTKKNTKNNCLFYRLILYIKQVCQHRFLLYNSVSNSTLTLTHAIFLCVLENTNCLSIIIYCILNYMFLTLTSWILSDDTV